jgi:hypothetical protein
MPGGLSKIEFRLGKFEYLQATFACELQLQRLDTEPILLLATRTIQHEAEPKDIRFDETLESDTRETLLSPPMCKRLPACHFNRSIWKFFDLAIGVPSDTLGHFIEQSERIWIGNQVNASKARQRSEHLIGNATGIGRFGPDTMTP